MNTRELLEVAIRQKKQVLAIYNGKRRETCPHVLGLSKKGALNCLFYQFAGESSSSPIVSGSNADWRCIPVAGLKDVVVRDGPWHTGGRHSRANTCIDIVYVEVDH